MFRLSLLLPVGLILVVLGCKSSDPASPGDPFIEAVITHFGFDFSAGAADSVDFDNNDGETIIWMPGGGEHPEYPNWSHVWFRTSRNPSVNETQDLGMVDLASVKTVPAAWDTIPPPLRVGHVIVAACQDGYVKFQVLSTDTTGMWPASVRYEFTTSMNFQ